MGDTTANIPLTIVNDTEVETPETVILTLSNPLNSLLGATDVFTYTITDNDYTLTYTAGANGTISGTTPQTVNEGTDGTAVTAVPADGYYFVDWSDASTANPRTDTNVLTNISVTANFSRNPPTSGSRPNKTTTTIITPSNTVTVSTACPVGHLFSTSTGLPCKTFFTPSNNTCVITQTLRQGDKGDQVKCLQTGLNILNDGIFGPMTKAAVISFQQLHNLVPDGIFGPKSLAQWGR
jgi:peptidoglycan hydrolase-like protein with peptidoglycan-binding domain